MHSVSLDTISQYDLVVLATDHDKYDYDILLNKSQLIVDTRGRFNHNHAKVVNA
jgi:UDP-N-acetyl-D-glucosamine dehydrogenase